MSTPEIALNDPVTNHMRVGPVRLKGTQTVHEALAAIRAKPPEGRIIYFYVLDENDRLIGVVPTRRLLLSPLEKKVSEIMVKDVVIVPADATVLDACEFFTLHRLLAFPVVDQERRLLGTIDVELYTTELGDIERSERNDTIFQLIGVHLKDGEIGSPVDSFKSRFPWLLCNVAGGMLAAVLSAFYEAELAKAVTLALFIPVVLALAESVSIQSVSLTLQLLHHQPPTVGGLIKALRTEGIVGLMLGGACAVLVTILALLWRGLTNTVICLFGGILGGVACAAIIGVTIPMTLRLLRRDPQVAAGPIALALTDMVTLLFYFNMARALVH